MFNIIQKLNDFGDAIKSLDLNATEEKIKALPQELKQEFKPELDALIKGLRVIEELTGKKTDEQIEKAIQILS